ncbi:GH32 C-terminal domain-containing protein [Staphylococcus carnosus]|uniref:beta-fructofuranosidase n=1 Tax=Staphylococcus carnosus TaxID=1281 RepID=A0AAJ0JNQ5_STACA|nr:GH32 C-terminal domain-containing protein [Staphylococcus carnosus]KKB24653.1 sucrose-6-phosphate hydrolase [Staphylococcus carnosus]QQS84818.1 GH32 C-terminal domain-containing protein [Staphylococcus carnosus]UTC00103.1 sucrose-6-phosphate hydrolase [Staphylococcus carnosus]UTC03108.1 sucrose-6-phosphate hydrolase [Staphylococcus carnosus]
MQPWSNEAAYQRIEQTSTEMLSEMKQQVSQSLYTQTFHLQPPFGAAGKPNGMIFYKGKYYISHEWYPFYSKQGLSYGYQYESSDLVHFNTDGSVLKPDSQYDNYGIKGGSTFVYQNNLHFLYTGLGLSREKLLFPYQLLAFINNHHQANKYPKPVVENPPENFLPSLQDPSVFEKNGQYYALFGAQTEEMQGRILVYHADNPLNWQYVKPIKTQLTDFGNVWTSPDYFILNGYDILMFTAQHEEGSTQAGFLLGHLDFNNFHMNHGDFKLLDEGFGFTSPQTFVDNTGEIVLMGLLEAQGDIELLNQADLAPCLSLPRTLSIEQGKLYQRPYKAYETLRYNEETALGYANKFMRQLHPYEGEQFEMCIDILENEATEIYFELRTSRNNATLITYNTHSRLVTLDCSESEALPQGDFGTKCSVQLAKPLELLRIFVDSSSIEIFCNDGERVMSSRIFPAKDSTGIRTATESGQVYLKFTKYNLNSIFDLEL